jgi:hypothetical protein
VTTEAGPTPALDATAIAQVITAGITRSLERTRRPAAIAHKTVWASGARECDRQFVLDLEGAPRPEFSVEVLAKFRRGEDLERALVIATDRAGQEADPPFRVIGQQERFELRDRKGRVCISGKVDARLLFDTITPKIAAPVEIKAWSPFLVDRIESFDDVFENDWTRPAGNQLLAYLYGAAEPIGFLFLERSGLPKILPVTLEHHLDRVEDFLTRAERALDHVEAGTMPGYLVGNAATCQRCPYFGSVCNPPLDVAGAVVLTDPEIEQALERREALRLAGEEFNRIDREVKQHLRGIEHGIAGAFAIEGKWGKSSKLDLPEDLRKQYTRTDPRGRFTIEITKVGAS